MNATHAGHRSPYLKTIPQLLHDRKQRTAADSLSQQPFSDPGRIEERPEHMPLPKDILIEHLQEEGRIAHPLDGLSQQLRVRRAPRLQSHREESARPGSDDAHPL